MEIKISDLDKSSINIVRLFAVLYFGGTLFFDIYLGVDFLRGLFIKPRDVFIFLMLCWFFLDRKSVFWRYLYSICLKNWEMWPVGFLFGWFSLVILKALMYFFAEGVGSSAVVEIKNNGSGRSLIYFFDAFGAAFTDELIYKPLLLISMRNWAGRWGFVFASGFFSSMVGLVYSGFHMMGFMMVYGWATAYMFLRFKNLGFFIFSHYALVLF